MPDTSAADNHKKCSIILHQIPRGYYCPSISPFPLKVELYLRINKIPYENDFSKPMGPKGKCPWITCNGQEIGDSQLIIEFLNEKFNIDMNDHLNPEQRAIAKAFRHLVEDHLYWAIVHERWVKSAGDIVKKLYSWIPGVKGKVIMAITRRRAKDQTSAQGMGRHTDEEIKKMKINAVNSLLTFLGSKKYLMGDKICEEDCSIWGYIVQIVYNNCGADEEKIKKLHEDFPNLKEYCERIKNEFWTDWNECLTTKPEEKPKEAKQKSEPKTLEKQENDEIIDDKEKENCEEKENDVEKPKVEEIPKVEDVKS